MIKRLLSFIQKDRYLVFVNIDQESLFVDVANTLSGKLILKKIDNTNLKKKLKNKVYVIVKPSLFEVKNIEIPKAISTKHKAVKLHISKNLELPPSYPFKFVVWKVKDKTLEYQVYVCSDDIYSSVDKSIAYNSHGLFLLQTAMLKIVQTVFNNLKTLIIFVYKKKLYQMLALDNLIVFYRETNFELDTELYEDILLTYRYLQGNFGQLDNIVLISEKDEDIFEKTGLYAYINQGVCMLNDRYFIDETDIDYVMSIIVSFGINPDLDFLPEEVILNRNKIRMIKIFTGIYMLMFVLLMFPTYETYKQIQSKLSLITNKTAKFKSKLEGILKDKALVKYITQTSDFLESRNKFIETVNQLDKLYNIIDMDNAKISITLNGNGFLLSVEHEKIFDNYEDFLEFVKKSKELENYGFTVKLDKNMKDKKINIQVQKTIN